MWRVFRDSCKTKGVRKGRLNAWMRASKGGHKLSLGWSKVWSLLERVWEAHLRLRESLLRIEGLEDEGMRRAYVLLHVS